MPRATPTKPAWLVFLSASDEAARQGKHDLAIEFLQAAMDILHAKRAEVRYVHAPAQVTHLAA